MPYLCRNVLSDVNFAELLTGWSTLALAILTLILCLVGFFQLKDIKKTSKADFILKFTLEFFNELNQALILLCDNFAIEYKTKEVQYNNQISKDSFPYFEVNQEILKQLPLDKKVLASIKTKYTCYEIDDFLGYFEDIGKFERQRLIDMDLVYNSFSWYIQIAAENRAIIQYLKTQKNRGDDFFENFKYISRKCKSLEKIIEKDKSVRLWKIRWFLSNWILKR